MFSLLQSPAFSERPFSERTWKSIQVVFLVFAGVYLLSGLNYPLLDVTETRAAEIAREILVNGNWATLSLSFEPYYHKPPLFYWLCAMSFSVFGINEWAARIVPALSTFGSIFLTVHFAARWFGAMVGLASGIILFLSSGFIGLSRFLVCDPLFTFFCTLTTFTGYEAIRYAMNPQRLVKARIWMLVCGLTCGLGFLTKGPVIGVLCGMPFLYAVFVIYRGQSLNWFPILWAVVAFGMVVAPWLAWMAAANPDYLVEFMLLHNVQRFSTDKFHDEPFWYFIPIFIAAGSPWSSLLCPFLVRVWDRRPYLHFSTPTFHYLLVTGVWCILFFSLSRGKLPTYILPAAAPLSITMAIYLVDLFSRVPVTLNEKISVSLSPILATLFTMIAMAAYLILAPVPWMKSYRVWGMTGPGIAVSLAVLLIWLFREQRLERWWIGCMGFCLVFSCWLTHCVVPNVGCALTCLGSEGSESQRAFVHEATQVITVGKPFYDALFYSQRSSSLMYETFDKKQIHEDLLRYKTIALIVSPNRVLPEQLQRMEQARVTRLISHPRYDLYQLELDRLASASR